MKDKLTQEDKDFLISQLENLMGTRPFFYLKFCSEEKFAHDVCNGDFYGNTAEYFRKKEFESGERGQGDQFELILPIKTEKVSMFDYETGDLVAVFAGGNAKLQYKDDNVIPIVCFVGIPIREMDLLEADETHAVFQFPFSAEEYDKMKEKFGTYCVVLGAKELEQRIDAVCRNRECDYIFDAVEYCCQNRIDRMKAFVEGSKKRFLYKNEDLKYQREYRLAVAEEIPVDHFLHFGKLENVKILPTDALQNMAFSIEYVSHVKEDTNDAEKADERRY